MSFSTFWLQKTQFNAPGFKPVKFRKSVELEILQVGEKVNETVFWQIGNFASNVSRQWRTSMSVWFTAKRLGRHFMA
jgi:hypothetical protein